ncbi:Hypothetical protein R9X50_00493900 [Acrodontium crateriforme]|uniref:Uncharacterized protein n=1 Tax=Acrodontium crateriforme TaxID=150365 RepID=A0AAQ3R8S0_9PEZI|nr:Hypothetical protein R9X50_00493900 [Acrodontium crateriforme]
MAEQVQTSAKNATDKVPGASSVSEKVQNATGGILSSIEGFAGMIKGKFMGMLDRFFPPEARANMWAKIQSFMLANPKLSAFLGMNLALTGIPLGLFILFTITVALFALIVGLLLGLLGAVIFILFCVGTALVIVLPFIFFTTAAATFLFLWGLGGYYIIKWANGGFSTEGAKEAPPGQAIGDRLNSLTGGRLSGFMDSARDERAKGDISGFNDTHNKPNAEKSKPKSSADQHKEDR